MCREFVMQISEVCLKVLKVIALRPVIWMIVQVTQKLSIRFFPVGDLRFHGFSFQMGLTGISVPPVLDKSVANESRPNHENISGSLL